MLDLSGWAVDYYIMKPATRRSGAVLVFTALLIFIVNFALWLFYSRTEAKYEEQLGRRLSSIAQLGSVNFTPELISGMFEGSLKAYDEALDLLDQIKASDSLSEVFVLYSDRRYLATTSLYLDSDSLYYLAAINSASIDSAFARGSSGLFETAPARAVVTPSYRIGDFLLKSSFAPLFDSTGAVAAILGVEADVDYTEELNDLKNSLYLASGISIGIGIFLAIIFIFLQRRMEASEKYLLQAQAHANLGRMVAVVSHEIKNPLMIIRASAESLGKKSGLDEADFIIDETDRLNRIVTGYLDFASGRYNLRSEKIDCTELIGSISGHFAPRLARDRTKLEIGSDLAPAYLKADPSALRQIIINLILNAADAIDDDKEGLIKIDVKNENTYITVTVTDNGDGIDSGILNDIFEPFYTTKTSGSGLGLFLTRKLTEQMEGTINIESERNRGTTVTLTFPRFEDGE